MRSTGIRPTITRLTSKESGAELELSCGACGQPFVSQQHLVCGVPMGDHHCPHCRQDQEIWPEHYEGALHQFMPRTAAMSNGFPNLTFRACAPTRFETLKRPEAKKKTILYAPAHPSGAGSLHAELARRMISLERRVLMLADTVCDRAEIRQKPDSEERTGRTTMVDEGKLRMSFAAWAKDLGVPVPKFVDGTIEQALANADLLITHVGAPWIAAALAAGIEVMALPHLPGKEGERIAPGAILLRDAQLEDAVRHWLTEQQGDFESTETIPVTPVTPVAPARSDNTLRILCAYRNDIDVNGGAGIVMRETKAGLEKRGHHVDVTYEVDPDCRGYDIVHCFNVWLPDTAAQQIRNVHRQGVPIVWSPIYLDLGELLWAGQFLCHMKQMPENQWPLLWQNFENGVGQFDDFKRWAPNEFEDGFFNTLAELVGLVDHVCVTSQSEVKALFQKTRASSFPFSVVPHGVHAETFKNATPELFVEQFQLKDFVLCVGSIERRKNQIMIMEALKNEDLDIVLIGPCFETDYLGACDKVGTTRVFTLGKQPIEMVASAFKAAAVHVLPSFAEGAALANLEAAVSECPMVVSNRSSEFEYFSDAVYYCDPTDRESIRRAVLQAIAEKEQRQVARSIIAQRTEVICDWDRTAELTEAIYRSLARAPTA
ncbi:MAG: glycosyltransferase involved in cell wall biosynthesis [Planctomycetota bacterium]|jgi:glycosyltransferase involved in cell wall biosynthesis